MISKRKKILWIATSALVVVLAAVIMSNRKSPAEGTSQAVGPQTAAKTNLPPTTNEPAHPAIELSEHARSMAAVETFLVDPRPLEASLHAVGKIQPNETTLAAVVSRVDGYVERLFVNFTGLEVRKGDHLAEIYSPDLVVAQQELLVASGAGAESSRLKLLRLGLTDEQVNALVREKKITDRVTLFSPIEGTVLEKMVVQNSAVKVGDVLYRLANLEAVWVYLDIYEYELQRVQYGRAVELSAESYPGQTFTGRVWFISPVVSEETRTVKVLVNIENRDGKLKPGMYVSASVRVPLLADGRPAPTGVEGQWTCPMHPSVLRPSAGKCPVCGMELVQIPGVPQTVGEHDQHVLAVPVLAVLDSGVRKLVYVERAPGEYAPVEVVVGVRAGGFYPVLKGLQGGERVVARGNFLLDSQFQIQGLASLFYPTGQAGGGAGHQHGSGTAPAAKRPPSEHKH
jgi:Cu(I)/Ag(I) efflux system membrane fusion protein